MGGDKYTVGSSAAKRENEIKRKENVIHKEGFQDILFTTVK